MEASREYDAPNKRIFTSSDDKIPLMRQMNYDSESQSTLAYSEDFSNQSYCSDYKEAWENGGTSGKDSSGSFATILKLLELEDMANALKSHDDGLLSQNVKFRDGVSKLPDRGDAQNSDSSICSNSKYIDGREKTDVTNIFKCMHESVYDLIDCDCDKACKTILGTWYSSKEEK